MILSQEQTGQSNRTVNAQQKTCVYMKTGYSTDQVMHICGQWIHFSISYARIITSIPRTIQNWLLPWNIQKKNPLKDLTNIKGFSKNVGDCLWHQRHGIKTENVLHTNSKRKILTNSITLTAKILFIKGNRDMAIQKVG